MAAKYPSDTERLEDVFQDEILKNFSSIVDFKKFARSKDGLCLDEPVIQSIVENNPNEVEEQKMRMLFKWKEKSGTKATASDIRSIVERFKEAEVEKDYVRVSQDCILYKSNPFSPRSRVYRGEQRMMTGTRHVAVKLTPLHGALDEKSTREVNHLLKISHPNVVTLLQSGIYEDSFSRYIYLVMERCQQENLEDFIQAVKKCGVSFPDAIKMAMSKQFLQGVEFIHRNNIIHRDIKPSNVLISENGNYIKVSDLGLGKGLTEGRSATNLSIIRPGTDGYRAPEVYWKNIITKQSDVYSSGLVVHTILSDGEHAYGKDHDSWNSNIKKNENRKLFVVLASEKKPIEKLLNHMLEHEPGNRPTAEEVLKNSIFVKVSADLQLGYFLRIIKASNEPSDKANVQASVKAIIFLFDCNTQHLLSFAIVTKQWTKMQPMPEEMDCGFTLLILEDCIHALNEKSMYQLKHSDLNEEWTELQGTKEYHGPWPSAVVLNGSIYVCGGWVATHSVEKYRAGQWHGVAPLNVGRRVTCAVVARDFIFCIGGRDDHGNKLRSVEKFDETSEKWSEIEPMPRPTNRASAVEKDNVLYVADKQRIQCFDIENESWKIMKPDHWPSRIHRAHIHVVNDELYLVFDFWPGVEIYHLDEKTEKMTLLCKRDDINMTLTNSVALML